MLYAPRPLTRRFNTSPAMTISLAENCCTRQGGYFDVLTPITGKAYTQAARSTAEDIELALDAAHAAAAQWGRTPPAERPNTLLKIADRIEQNLELLAYAETVDNGKAIRETLNADIPLTVDHFRYFCRLPALPGRQF